MPEIVIPPSELALGNMNSGAWVRGIPTPGVTFAPLVKVLPVSGIGVATCADLFSPSPPTLLEQYEAYSYSIGWTAEVTASSTAPNVTVEIAFLVNDRVRYVTRETELTELDTATGLCFASGSFVSDLVNPIDVGGRERLSLRVGASVDQAITAGLISVGVQAAPTGGVGLDIAIIPFESTISYRTIELPAKRRL